MGRLITLLIALILFGSIFAFAQETAAQSVTQSAKTEPAATGEGNADTLRKAAQNPIASMTSVPLQNNANFGIEPGGRTQDVLNIQPVIAVGVGKDWNLIIRWIAPIVWQPLPAPGPAPEVGKYGFGDMLPSFFFSSKKAGTLIGARVRYFNYPRRRIRTWVRASSA